MNFNDYNGRDPDQERIDYQSEQKNAWAPVLVLAFMSVLFVSLAYQVQADRICGYGAPHAYDVQRNDDPQYVLPLVPSR
jgi:hypothetical protein